VHGAVRVPAALEGLAQRAPLPVHLETATHERLPDRVESASYFVVAEALTNVAAPTRRPAPACAVYRTASPRSAAASTSTRRRVGARPSERRSRTRTDLRVFVP
jgi:hypothetical protein